MSLILCDLVHCVFVQHLPGNSEVIGWLLRKKYPDKISDRLGTVSTFKPQLLSTVGEIWTTFNLTGSWAFIPSLQSE